MTTSHTPGPWHFTENMYGVDNLRVFGVTGGKHPQGIANCGYDKTGESAANACLIAYAPELLAVTNQFIEMLEGWIAEGSLNPEPRSNLTRIMDEARAIITKATNL